MLEQAKRIREDAEGLFGFDSAVDRVVVFFDADIYKNDQEEYAAVLGAFAGVAEVAVTYPSFELFLLLHLDDALDSTIWPNEDAILANGYVGRRRFVEKLATDELGFNVKKNKSVGSLSSRFGVAVMAESQLNQNPSLAIGCLTSNVGACIMKIVREGALQSRSFCNLCKQLGIEWPQPATNAG